MTPAAPSPEEIAVTKALAAINWGGCEGYEPACVPEHCHCRQAARAAIQAYRSVRPEKSRVVEDETERREGQLIDERDAAEEALSQAYYLVIGHSPEWSNKFGAPHALEEIADALSLLRAAARPVEVRPASGEVEALVAEARALSLELRGLSTHDAERTLKISARVQLVLERLATALDRLNREGR